jgi:hypothetical protein
MDPLKTNANNPVANSEDTTIYASQKHIRPVSLRFIASFAITRFR